MTSLDKIKTCDTFKILYSSDLILTRVQLACKLIEEFLFTIVVLPRLATTHAPLLGKDGGAQ
jgi:hypothetical protein